MPGVFATDLAHGSQARRNDMSIHQRAIAWDCVVNKMPSKNFNLWKDIQLPELRPYGITIRS